MKLSQAIEKGLVKEGDEIEVSYKATLSHEGGLTRLNLIKDLGGSIFFDKELEIIELIDPVPEQSSATQSLSDCQQLNSDVGKTFKLCEAKEHLKVGMEVEIRWSRLEGKGKIIGIDENEFSIFKVPELEEEDTWTVKILSDPTVKDSLPVQKEPEGYYFRVGSENLNCTRVEAELFKRVIALEHAIDKPEKGVEEERSITEHLERIDDAISNYPEFVSSAKYNFNRIYERLKKLESFMELHKKGTSVAEVDHDKYYDALNYRLAKVEADIALIQCDHLPLRTNRLEKSSQNHSKRIDELEEQVQQLKKSIQDLRTEVYNPFAPSYPHPDISPPRYPQPNVFPNTVSVYSAPMPSTTDCGTLRTTESTESKK